MGMEYAVSKSAGSRQEVPLPDKAQFMLFLSRHR